MTHELKKSKLINFKITKGYLEEDYNGKTYILY